MTDILSFSSNDKSSLAKSDLKIVTSDRKNINEIAICNLEDLLSLLTNAEITNKKIVVISIVGILRNGKSFLMNYLLRYLQSDCNLSSLCNLDQILVGFDWRTGINLETNGIHIWNEIFTKKVNGENVVIILLDTEGIFNKTSTYEQSVHIGALAFLLSSFVIVNVTKTIDHIICDYIETCANFAHWLLDFWTLEKPFENIMFVVRDWHGYSNFPFGLTGGIEYLKLLSKNSKSGPRNEPMIHKYFSSIFSNMQCCLMPHPGLKASTTSNFDGRIRDLDSTFVETVKQFVVHIFSSPILKVKTIKGHSVKCRAWVSFFQSFVKIIKQNTLTRLDYICQENSCARKFEVMENMINFYISQMDKFLLTRRSYFSSEKIKIEHSNIERNIVEKLSNSNLLFKKLILDELKSDVIQHLRNILDRYLDDNNHKNLQLGMFTPFAFIVLLLFMYILRSAFSWFNIKIVNDFVNTFWITSLVLTVLWMIAIFWDFEELSGLLDEVADLLIINIYNPIVFLWQNKPSKAIEVFYQSVTERNAY